METAVETKRLTVAEFRQMEFDDHDPHLYELLDGDIVKRNAPTPQHQRLVRDLAFALHIHVQTNNMGEILFAPVDVFLDDSTGPQPDLVFVADNQRGIITEHGVFAPGRLASTLMG